MQVIKRSACRLGSTANDQGADQQLLRLARQTHSGKASLKVSGQQGIRTSTDRIGQIIQTIGQPQATTKKTAS
jgi:hypothetical protein